MTPFLLQSLQFVLLALALIANLCLFLSLKREFRKQNLDQRAAMELVNSQLEKALNRPIDRLNEGPAVTPRSTLDPTCRLQMIQRLREGQSAPQVAADFGIPLAEVELLIRLHQMTASTNGAPRVFNQG